MLLSQIKLLRFSRSRTSLDGLLRSHPRIRMVIAASQIDYSEMVETLKEIIKLDDARK